MGIKQNRKHEFKSDQYCCAQSGQYIQWMMNCQKEKINEKAISDEDLLEHELSSL